MKAQGILAILLTTGLLVQTGEMEAGPDQVAFSDELAYVRHRGSETVLTIPLGVLGREGTPVQVVDFPGGSAPAGRNVRPTPAAGRVQAPGAPAMLVANTEDEMIVRPLTEPRVLAAGVPVDLRFRVTDPLARQPLAPPDFTVMAMLAGSNWYERGLAEAEGDGVYRLRFTPPRPGVYYVYVASPSRGAGFNENPYQIFRAVDGDAAPGDGEPEQGGRS